MLYGVIDPRNNPLPSCYRVQFGSNCIDVRIPKIWRMLGSHTHGMGCSWSSRNMPLPCCYLTEFGHSRSNNSSVIMEICIKIWTPCESSFKVIWGHQNQHRSNGYYDFLLTFHSNHGHISYCFQHIQEFQLKIAIVFCLRVFNVPTERVPLGTG